MCLFGLLYSFHAVRAQRGFIDPPQEQGRCEHVSFSQTCDKTLGVKGESIQCRWLSNASASDLSIKIPATLVLNEITEKYFCIRQEVFAMS